MSVSSLKGRFIMTSRCLLTINIPILRHSPRIIGLMGPLGLQLRAMSYCTNAHRPMPKCSFFLHYTPSCVKPIHHLCCHCRPMEPFLAHSFMQSNISACYSTENQASKPEKNLSLLQRFKQMYRDYWYVLLPVHAVTSLAWFGGFYYLLKSGVDVVGILESYEINEKVIQPLRDSSAGYLAVSYALYKIATPLRYTVTLGGTTISINYLKKWGYIRPMPPRQKLKEMYEERRDNLKERRDSIMESVRGTKEELRGHKDQIIESVHKTAKELKPEGELLKKAVKTGERESK